MRLLKSRGCLILAANGLAKGKKASGTPGLIQELRRRDVKVVAHFDWASFGQDKTSQNDEAIASLKAAGFCVMEVSVPGTEYIGLRRLPDEAIYQGEVIHPGDVDYLMARADVWYLNGGDPVLLLNLLKEGKYTADIFRHYLNEGGIIIACSAGAMALASGTMVLASVPKERAYSKKRCYTEAFGLGLVIEGGERPGIVPHAGQFLAFLSKLLFFRSLRVKELVAIKDGEYFFAEW